MTERRHGESKRRWGLWTLAGAGGLALAAAAYYLSDEKRRQGAIDAITEATQDAKDAVRDFVAERDINTLGDVRDIGKTGVNAFFGSLTAKGNKATSGEAAPAGDEARPESFAAADAPGPTPADVAQPDGGAAAQEEAGLAGRPEELSKV